MSQLLNFLQLNTDISPMLVTDNNIREKEIIYAARKTFYEKGFKKATTRLIAKNANINHAMIHYYFRGKKKLAIIVLDDFYRTMNFLVIPYFSKITDPMLFEAVMLRVIYYHILNDPGFFRFYFEIVDNAIAEKYFMDYGIKLFIKSAIYHNKAQDEETARLNQIVISSFEQSMFKRIAKKNPEYSYEQMIDFLITVPLRLIYFEQQSIEEILKQSKKTFDKIEPLSVPVIDHFGEPVLSKRI